MKDKLVEYITLSFFEHINYMLENKDKEYLDKMSFRNISNRQELLDCKQILEQIVKPNSLKHYENIIERWAKNIDVDYNSYDFVQFSRIFAKRILDIYYQNKKSRAELIDELLSFKYETYQLNLAKTVKNESIAREMFRSMALEYDKNSWPYILDQSKDIHATFVKYFEGVLETTSEELKILNTKLEEKVEEKSKELLDTLYNDKLTKLPNINAFEKDTKQCEEKNIVLFNIDGFRKINSIYGMYFADQVLIKTMEKINDQVLVCGNYKLYRYHGDWFIILETNKNKNNIEDVYNAILTLFENESIVVENEALSLNFTAGLAKGYDEPIRFAELAYQKAKDSKSTYEIYDGNTTLVENYKQHQHVLKIIKTAIKNDLVFPYFQLIRDNKNPHKKKYEALMRIEGAFGQILSPFIFLDIAKDAKLYGELARIMMKKSIQTFENIDASFSINLEVEDVLNENTMIYLHELIVQYNVKDKIILEITESEDIKDFKKVIEVFKSFKDMGIKVAIDDFGTGYSNFSYLLEFDFDFIKIDGSLIKNIHIDKDSYIIAQLIVDFAKRLNKKVIAEFIENDEVQKVIEKLGIDYSQGYLFSKPARKLI